MTYDEYARICHDAQDLRWNYGKFNAFKQEFGEFLANAEMPEKLSKNLGESYCLIAEYCERLRNDIKHAEAKAIKRNYAEEASDCRVEITHEQEHQPVDDTPFMPVDCVFYAPQEPIDYISLGMGC